LDIELNLLSKEIILVLLLCKDLKLNFKEIKKLYLGNDKVFWKYIFSLFPLLKITEDRFNRLSKLASTIYDKLINENIKISPKDENYYEYVRLRIKNRYEHDGDLYEFKDFIDYIKFNKTPNIKYGNKSYTKYNLINNRNKICVSILLYDGDYLINVSEYDLIYFKDKIFKVVLSRGEEDKVIFTKTSEYSFITKDKDEPKNLKISPIFKNSSIVDIYRKEDILDLIKDDCLNINKDLYIHCKLDLDINMKCKNIFSDYDLSVGNLEAINVNVVNLTANTIKVTNLNATNINARNIEVLNKLVANKINYYAVCFAYIGIECNYIKGSRTNSKHFVLDGELKINGKS